MPEHHHETLPRLAQSCGSDGEILAITVMRLLAAGYMTGDAEAWDAAHDGAERLLGAREGARFVADLTCLMRAIRRERPAPLLFLPAACCRISGDERALLAMICAEGDASARAAASFAGRPHAPRLAEAAGMAAEALDRAQSRLDRDGRGAPAQAAPLH